MKHLVKSIIVYGGALLLCSTPTKAEPYTLLYGLVHPNSGILNGSRMPKHPLVVDLEGHTLTFPSQIVGYTLTLESEYGKVYTYSIIDRIFQVPQQLKGKYIITIFDENNMYHGVIDLS